MATDRHQRVEEGSTEERLKAALWYSIGQTVDAVGMSQNINATPHFIGALSELVWERIQTTACDVESFAKHDGGRTIVKAKDVELLGRRNQGLEAILKTEAEAARERDGDERRSR